MKSLRRLPLSAVLAFLFCGVVLCGSFFNSGYIKKVFAADGSGTNTVFPTTATTSTTGNTFTFTYTASEVLDSGGIRITVPAGGWSVPQGNSGIAGYTTATSTGTIADVKNNLDSSTGWAVTNHMTLSADTGDKQEGTASLSNVITSQAAANEQWYFNYGGTEDWGASADGNLRVGMWLKSSVATASGNLSWQDDNTANLASPLDTIAIPALSANTWTYTSATLGATARNTILSYGFRYTTDIGVATVKADSLSVLVNSNDSNAGWTGDANITDSLITGAGNFMEGTGSVRCTYASTAGTGTNGDCYNNEGASITVGPGTTVTFWVRSSVALNANDFAWVDDNSSAIGSADSVVNLPAIPANTWTYIKLTSGTSGDMRSFGLRQLVDKGAMTIDIDAIGKQIDAADSTTGWTAPTSSVQVVSTDVGVFHEGTGSLKDIITASATAGDKWYQALGVAENWSGYTDVGFWIRSTVATAAGQLKFEYASSSDLTSPAASIDIGALAANTWTYQKLALTGTRTSILSYGINYSADIGAVTVYLDDVLLGPGGITFSGNDINARILSLSGAQTIITTYGSGGGTSGVTTPATPAVYTFTTASRNSDSGTLTNIVTSPTVTVSLPATATTVETSGSPSVYGNTVTFTATVTPAGGGAPSGTVTFKDGPTTIGTGILNGANPGVATLDIATLTVLESPHSITAVYEGDSGHSGSTSAAISQNVTPKTLTVAGITADNKEYDRSTAATIHTGSAALVGVVSPDIVTLNTGSAVGAFNDFNVGTGKTVTISGLSISGADASNYSLTQPTTTANITAKNLTVTGITADDKVYDGNDTAVIHTGSAALVGVISPDVVTLNTASAVGAFSDSNVGVGKTVTISGLTISGADSGNYALIQPTTTASITTASLTVAGITASDKIYDGFTTATLNTASATLVGVTPGDVVTLNTGSAVGNFSDKNVGVGKTVTISGLTISGTDASKYTLTQPSATASITAKNLTVTGITASDKPYDGNNTATLNTASAVLVGVIAPDIVTLNTASAVGVFSDASVGVGKTVTISGLTISGTDASNYSLTQPTTTASITGASLTVAGITASDKIYDGFTTATLNTASATLVGVTPGDVVTLNTGSAVGNFSDKNVGIGKTVTISGLTISGADAGEYSLIQPTATASITAKNLTISGITANNKVFDGNTSAVLVGAPGTLVGVIAPDIVTIAGTAVGNFSDANIGTGKTVTISGLSITGADSGNYSLTAPTAVADITSGVIPIVATKLVIVQPADATVGSVITVTIRAENNSGQLDTSFNNVITLIASGSVTGAGPVTIANGIGTIDINDSIAETVILGLLDTVGLGLDVSSTKNVSWTTVVVPPVAPAPPRSIPIPTVRGVAFPGANISISTFSGSATLETARTVSSSNGFFDIPLKSTGTASYGIVATDANGDRSQAKVFSLNLDIGGINTNLSIIIPPTAKLMRSSVTKGDNTIMTGYGSPNSAIQLFVDGSPMGGIARTDESGKYRIIFNTVDLSIGNHEVMVNETLQDGIVSDYSIRRTLTVSSLFTPKADFNKDNKIDIQDWSIFLSKWNAPGNQKQDLDLNGDGSIDIADFSIMLRAVQK